MQVRVRQTARECEELGNRFDSNSRSLDELRLEFHRECAELGEILNIAFTRMDKKFDEVDKRFDEVDKRFDDVDKKFEVVQARLDAIKFGSVLTLPSK